MNGRWFSDWDGVGAGGDVGGDGQLTEAYEVRYYHTTILHGVVNVWYFGEDINAPGNYTGVMRITKMTEFIECRDRMHPGDTEIFTDITYETVGEDRYTDVEAAAARAKELAKAHTGDMITWDGSPRI